MFLGSRFEAGVVRGIKAAGVSRLELFMQRPHFDALDVAQIAEVRAALDQNGVEVISAHAPIYRDRLKDRAARKQLKLSLCDPDKTTRDAATRELKASIEACAALGAANLVLHTGLSGADGGENGVPDEVSLCIESLHAPAVRAKELGVSLALENGTEPGVSVGLLIEVVRRLDMENVGVCFDAGHSNLYGNPHADVREARPYLCSLHLHDNEGTDDLHLVPGRGTVDFWDIIAFLRKSSFIGILAMEVGIEEGVDPDRPDELFGLAGRVAAVMEDFDRGMTRTAAAAQ